MVRPEGQAVPAADPLLRRRRDEALRRGALPAAQGGLRRAEASRRDLARVADLVRRAGAVLHEGGAAVRGARRARRGPDRPAGERALSVPGGVARAADPAARRRSREGRLPPVPRAVRRAAERGEPAVQRLRPLHELRRLPLRGAREVGRGGARRPSRARARERDAADERAGGEAGDERGRHGRDGGRRRARRRDRALRRRPRRPRLRRREHREAAPALRDRQACERARQRVGPGRPQLHVPQQPGRARAVPRGEPDRLPEDARAQRLLLRQRRARLSAREHPDGRQVAGGHVPRREAGGDGARAGLDARPRREARDRLLALDRGPAARGEPRHRRQGRQAHARVRADERGAEAAAVRQAEVDPRQARPERGPSDPAVRVPEERDPGRGRRAPGGHLPVRRRSGDARW